jgi:hypothetical protein
MTMSSASYTECLRIEENSTYSAETHHILAKRVLLWYKLYQLVPAVATALIGTLTVGQIVPQWVGVLGLLTAVVAAIGTVLNPQQSYFEHVSAAKEFTTMKHDARALREQGEQSASEDLAASARCLHDRYNDLIRVAPLTKDWAFEKARKRIQAGVHTPDEKS